MRKREKIVYEVDPHNRLVLKSGKPSKVKQYRAILEGSFKVDKNNYLVYHAKKPSPVFSGKKLPQQIKLKGSWSLTRRHNLVYTLDKWQNQIYGNRLVLKGGVMDVTGNQLLFTLTTREKRKGRTYVLALSGTWYQDQYNRLTFDVKRETDKDNAITFKNRWRVDRNNEIVYEYERRKRTYSISFIGYWDITKKHKLFYRLDKSKDSVFDFRVSIGTFKKRNSLQYRIGIGTSRRKRPKMRIITIFGKWRIKKGLGFAFEMAYGKDKIRSVVFGASIRLNRDHTLEVGLKDRRNQPLGIKFTLSRSFFKNQAKAFISLLKDKRELTITAGTGFLF